jgi:predicted RND superfamily exporter protein
MRWKLLIIVPLLVAIASAGAIFGLVYFLGVQPANLIATPNWLTLIALAVPVAAITYAAIFVYRHNARRRVLQAILTVLLSIVLTLAALYLGPRLPFARPTPAEPRPKLQNAG